VLLEGVWAIVSAFSLVGVLRARNPASPSRWRIVLRRCHRPRGELCPLRPRSVGSSYSGMIATGRSPRAREGEHVLRWKRPWWLCGASP